MKLDPERPLSLATIDAIRDLVEVPVLETVDDVRLLAVALGVADGPTRLACARAVLHSPAARARLLTLRASIAGPLAAPVPGGEDADDLRRLSAFDAPFDQEAAGAVFPARFAEESRLRRLAEGGWLEATEPLLGPFYAVPDRFRVEERTLDERERARFVAYFANLARWIDRNLAEGIAVEALAVFRRVLPDLRAAWNAADTAGDAETVAVFVDSVTAELAEAGEFGFLSELAQAGYRAADALNLPRLRSKLLSYEGAAAARRAENALAVELWERRLELNRAIGNSVAEADTLVDLASEALEVGDDEAFDRWIVEAEDAVGRAGRADLTAGFWTVRANARLRAGDLENAVAFAERAMADLSGNLGLEATLYVRASVAQILVRAGQGRRAVQILAELLQKAIEASRPAQGAMVMSRLATVLVEERRIHLAGQCLRFALAIQRSTGSRLAERTSGQLAAVKAENPNLDTSDVDAAAWPGAAYRILAELREGLPGAVAVS